MAAAKGRRERIAGSASQALQRQSGQQGAQPQGGQNGAADAMRERVLGQARELGYSGPDPVARRLRTGAVDVNGGSFNPFAPFGGYKQSGIGRELGAYGLAEFQQVKAIQR